MQLHQHHMKSFIFIVFIAAVYAVPPLPTITVGNFINTPVWYPGDLIDIVSAQWSGGAGILTDRKVPNVVIKNNDGTYRTIVAPFECVSRSPSNIPKFITLTNGKIFSCDQTLFELDNNKNNIVNAKNITFPTSLARIMADNSIVTLAQDPGVFTSGKLQTWNKDNSDWTMQHELVDVGYGMTFISEGVAAIYNKSNNAFQVLDRQSDNSYTLRRTSTALLSLFVDNFPPMVYLDDDTIITGIRDPVLLQPYIYFDKVANGINLPVKLHQYDSGSASFAFKDQYFSDVLDVKPISGLGSSMLAITHDIVIVVAPYDNYNLTRVLKNGSALVFRRQQDNTWKFETKFVQANPEEAQLNSVAGYEDGRLYFVACRTGFAEGNRSRARKECGFKYAEWNPPASA